VKDLVLAQEEHSCVETTVAQQGSTAEIRLQADAAQTIPYIHMTIIVVLRRLFVLIPPRGG